MAQETPPAFCPSRWRCCYPAPVSYDLFFRPKSSPPTGEHFKTYFADRAGYTFQGEAQAFYENGDTGVYFYFEYHEAEDDDARDVLPIVFNLNYFRPHFFGLEAAGEVERFVQAFDLNVIDPQTEGMGEGPFSRDGFLRGWNAGNRVAYRAILSLEDRPEVYVYPTDGLERVWEWNHGRDALQERVGDGLFVPKLMFMKSGQRACTAIVWPDGCPICMPRADLVFLHREQLSTERPADEGTETTVVPWQRMAPLVADFQQEGTELPYFRLDHELIPDEIVDFVRSLPTSPPNTQMGLAYDQVLNEELVAQTLQPSG